MRFAKFEKIFRIKVSRRLDYVYLQENIFESPVHEFILGIICNSYKKNLISKLALLKCTFAPIRFSTSPHMKLLRHFIFMLKENHCR